MKALKPVDKAQHREFIHIQRPDIHSSGKKTTPIFDRFSCVTPQQYAKMFVNSILSNGKIWGGGGGCCCLAELFLFK